MERKSKVELFEQIRREYDFGDGTVLGIARKLGCTSPCELARFNHLKAPDYLLRTGQDLRVAGCSRN